jgi:hypothetical protein
MKKSELRQLIREEIQTQLLNNTKLAKFIEQSNIPDSDFHPQDKITAAEFVKYSKPSSAYLQKLVDIFKKNDIILNLSDFYTTKQQFINKPETIDKNINPYDPLYRKHYNYPSESGD